jgi:hypothetical protein
MITQFPANNESIDYAHQKIHEGRFFSGGYYNSSLSAGSSQDILVQVGSSSNFHAIMAVSISGEATVFIYEGTTFSAAGSAVTMTNHNRTSAKVFSGTVTYSPTVTGTGDSVERDAVHPCRRQAYERCDSRIHFRVDPVPLDQLPDPLYEHIRWGGQTFHAH